jgi:hypothetical protein
MPPAGFLCQKIETVLRGFYFCSNFNCETKIEFSSACGAGKLNFGFLKASRRVAFKKPIFKMRIAAIFGIANNSLQCYVATYQRKKLCT